jgi:hypothetical protein
MEWGVGTITFVTYAIETTFYVASTASSIKESVVLTRSKYCITYKWPTLAEEAEITIETLEIADVETASLLLSLVVFELIEFHPLQCLILHQAFISVTTSECSRDIGKPLSHCGNYIYHLSHIFRISKFIIAKSICVCPKIPEIIRYFSYSIYKLAFAMEMKYPSVFSVRQEQFLYH